MAEDDSLDSFLAGNTPKDSIAENGGVNQQTATPRPKLKKIKRAKIRPHIDIPQAPEKIMPNVQETQEHKGAPVISAPHEQLDVSVSNVTATVEDIVEKESSEELNTSSSTSLVTAAEVQNITTNSTQNSYVLDGLPPELDYMTDENAEEEFASDTGYVKKNIVYIAACACLLVGLFTGKLFFAEQKVENYGLEGVVANPDVPAGRPRCGLTDKSQACVFYMLNWYKQELNGRDFYKLTAQLTGREEYMIETDNLRYANVKIKPGHFAQLNIPALK